MKLVETRSFEKLKSSGHLPSPNGLALAIIKLLQREDYKTDDLVRLIESDPAIAGELLKISNAASFGQSRPIVSIPNAVTMIGTMRVRGLVLALSVLQNHRNGNCSQFDYGKFWSRALVTAISAQALASYAKVNPDDNFTAGLLCSIGELSLASIYPDRYGEIISVSEDDIHKRIALEREAFNIDHRELSATLILEWGLPEVLAIAIYHCEFPDDTDLLEGSRIHELTLSLHIALALADICVADDARGWMMLPNLYAKAARFGISTDELNSIVDGIILRWIEWGELLKIQTCQMTSFKGLLASTQPREQATPSPICLWPNNKSALLICKDTPEFSVLTSHFELNGFTVMCESNSANGLIRALEERPDLILIQMSASAVDGPSFCKALRDDPRGRSTYIVIIVDQEDEGLFTQVFDMHADDFLLRPITRSSLQAKFHGIFKILQLQKKLVKERNSLVTSAGEWAGTNRRLIQGAMTDPLTHLSNRRYGLDFLAREWEFSKSTNLPLSCLMIDVDHFKQVNDRHGHQSGDTVLINLARILQASARNVDLVFRYGGEEFCIVCPGATLEMACALAERMRRNVSNQPFNLGREEIRITVSIGVALRMQAHADQEALMHDADIALYRAKEAGRNRVESGILRDGLEPAMLRVALKRESLMQAMTKDELEFEIFQLKQNIDVYAEGNKETRGLRKILEEYKLTLLLLTLAENTTNQAKESQSKQDGMEI